MSLRLNLLKSPAGAEVSRTQHSFDFNGGTIGRNSANTWQLPDPDKFLSSCHCEISFAGNQYFLLDRSTNGTFVNGASEPIGRGNRLAINNGDYIELGDYRFSVEIASTTDSFSQDAFDQDPFRQSQFDADPFGKTPLNSDPFAIASPQAANFAADPFNDGFSLRIETNPTFDQDPFARSVNPASQGLNVDDIFATNTPLASADNQDPLAYFGGLTASSQSTSHEPLSGNYSGIDSISPSFTANPSRSNANYAGFAASESSPQDLCIDNLLGLSPQSHNADFASIDDRAAPDQAISWPNTHTENLIPDDWTDDFLSDIKDVAKSPAAAQFPQASAAAPQAEPQLRIPTPSRSGASSAQPFGQAASAALPATSNRVASAPKMPLADRLAALNAITSGAAIQPSEADQGFSAQHHQLPQDVYQNREINEESRHTAITSTTTRNELPLGEAAIKAAAPNPAHTPMGPASAASSRFVDALGLDQSRLNSQEIAEIETMAGHLLREVIDGMLGVLRSRANIKNEFRMNVTTIQPIENNPLKFSVNVDDALENLFLKKSNAFKRPPQAFKEGFQEIAEHQLAMIAGIRAGFDQIMERFNPVPLETIFNKQIKGSVIPGLQKAKYWSSYQDYYQQLSDNMDHAFQQLFGSEFVTAYEDQLRRLAAARHKENKHGSVNA